MPGAYSQPVQTIIVMLIICLILLSRVLDYILITRGEIKFTSFLALECFSEVQSSKTQVFPSEKGQTSSNFVIASSSLNYFGM